VVGDGATDDSPAINALIVKALRTSAPFREIYFPPGTYLISDMIHLDGEISGADSIALVGQEGTTIITSSGYSAAHMVEVNAASTHTNIHIRKIKFSTAVNTANLAAISFATDSGSGVVDQFTVADCEFDLGNQTQASSNGVVGVNLGRNASAAIYATNGIIENNRFNTVDGVGIYCQNASALRIFKNAHIAGKRGVHILCDTNSHATHGIQVIGNHYSGIYHNAIHAIANHTTRGSAQGHLNFSHNFISQHASAAAGTGGVYVENFQGVVVEGNTIVTTTQNGIDVQGCSVFNVANNTISGCGLYGLELDDGSANALRPIAGAIVGNTISNITAGSGMILFDCAYIQCQGNLIYQYGASTNDAGIKVGKVAQTVTEVSVIGNTTVNAIGGAYGVSVESDVGDCTLIGNSLYAGVDDPGKKAVIIANNEGSSAEVSYRNTQFTYTDAMVKWAQGTYSFATNTLTINEDGNTYLIDESANIQIDDITAMQAGSMIWLFNDQTASETITITDSGNITVVPDATGIILYPGQAVSLVSDGLNWAAQGGIWNYNSVTKEIAAYGKIGLVPSGTAAADSAIEVFSGAYDQGTGTVAENGHGGLTINGVVFTNSGTITRYQLIQVGNPTQTGGGAITDGVVFDFQAAAGTHVMVDAGTTKGTPGTVDAWMKIEVDGDVHYVPAYMSSFLDLLWWLRR
jgi:parallel beta-helix repeat protein